jgi:hypothetical protein
MRGLFCWVCVVSMMCSHAAAQDERRLFAGALVGVSTLSADGRAVTSAPNAAISLYKPENGPALDVFAGFHVHRYFSLQANYMWNRNDVALISSFVTPQGGGFYEQHRESSQHVVVGDTLIYFRRLGSGIRPYLGTGICVRRFSSSNIVRSISSSLAAPTAEIASTRLALRSHVGIDFAIARHIAFRYSFSETIGDNPLSPHLTPPGQRGMANFQNFFGFLVHVH